MADDGVPLWVIVIILCMIFFGGIAVGWAYAVVAQSGCDCNQEMIQAYVDGLDACDRFWENTSKYYDIYTPLEPVITNYTFVNTTFWNESAKAWEVT